MENYREQLRLLTQAMNQIDGLYYQAARKLGVKDNTLALLYALDDGKPHSQKQIGEEWLIPKTVSYTHLRRRWRHRKGRRKLLLRLRQSLQVNRKASRTANRRHRRPKTRPDKVRPGQNRRKA